jgi:hypothetical protein
MLAMKRKYKEASEAPDPEKKARLGPKLAEKTVSEWLGKEVYGDSALQIHPLHTKVSMNASVSDSWGLKLLSTRADCFLTGPQDTFDLTLEDLTAYVISALYKKKEKIALNDLQPDPVRDQGFTAAKALILLPQKYMAKTVLETIKTLHCKNRAKRIPKPSRQKYEDDF